MKRIACLCLAVFLSGCSAQMVELASPMSVVEIDEGLYRLQSTVTVKAAHAAPLELRAGTTWRQIGTIAQGNVWDTKDQVVIVNSFDVHEAAVVTNNNQVVGFYLKVAKTFVEANPVPISLVTTE